MPTQSRPEWHRVVIAVAVSAAVCLGNFACHSRVQSEQSRQVQKDWSGLRSEMKVRLATEQFKSGRTAEAVVTLGEAIRLDVDNPALHRLMARYRLEFGELRDAEDALSRARELGDESADLAYTYGLVAERQWRQEEALKHYRRAYALEPQQADYASAVAECLTSLDRPGEARALLDDAIARSAHDPKLLLARAGVCALLNDFEQSARDYERLSFLLGDVSWIAERYGLLLLRMGRYEESLSVLEPLVREGPSVAIESGAELSPAVIRAVATCCNRLGRPEAARTYLSSHVAEHPDDARAWWVYAESAVLLGDGAEARRCVVRGRRLAPEQTRWDTLDAYLSWHSGDEESARALLESRLADSRGDALIHCFLGEIYRDRHDSHQALAHFESALAIDPANTWAKERTDSANAGPR